MATPQTALLLLLVQAKTVGASDLHLQAGAPPLMRVDGKLQPLRDEPLTPQQSEALTLSLLDDMHRGQLQQERQVDLAAEVKGIGRFRINVFFQRETVAAALRLIPTDPPALESLGLPEVISRFLEAPQGLFLVTGPTGSGKSTTLAALVDRINQREARHIITLEDPIEYVYTPKHSLIAQREIGRDVSDFPSGLRAALREDPDVLLVGEMRDPLTIATALTAAETGHLVFSTLHTPDAAQAIDRIVDCFPAAQQGQVRSQLAGVLLGIVAQRLLPKVPSARLAVAEVLVNTPAVASLIRQQKIFQIPSTIETGARYGMQSMAQAVRRAIEAKQLEAKEAEHLFD
ncbi:MAG: type IV pilus twitching motility protein PilT [Firmicutes bacterium]|nr:type IV pilus twitching motility protein PilT [Bacillota bacterium]